MLMFYADKTGNIDTFYIVLTIYDYITMVENFLTILAIFFQNNLITDKSISKGH